MAGLATVQAQVVDHAMLTVFEVNGPCFFMLAADRFMKSLRLETAAD